MSLVSSIYAPPPHISKEKIQKKTNVDLPSVR